MTDHVRPSRDGGCPTRRQFLVESSLSMAALGAFGAGGAGLRASGDSPAGIRPMGPGSKVVPAIRAAFVRRKGDYGMLWPGAVYDGEGARRTYTEALLAAGKELNLRIDLRPEPIHSEAEARAWVEESRAAGCDGLLVLVLDRQQHAWPTARLAIESGIPAVVFAPIGTAFTVNTRGLSGKGRSTIASTDDFGRAIYGLRMIRAHLRLEAMRFVVLKGDERRDGEIRGLGTKLRYLPARLFLEEYRRLPVSGEVRALAAECMKGSEGLRGTTEADVVNGLKSYAVARGFLEREEGDGITMDCLGALGGTEVSLPCIAWSRMLDAGIPAACEADLNAAATHALVLDLFGVPGFQQDPVPETSRGTLIGAHCTCPTRLRGVGKPAVPYFLTFHHGKRDAVPRPRWTPGDPVTVAQFVLPAEEDEKVRLLVSEGSVVDNIGVPPAGGCVVSVEVKLDGVEDLLDYPGFHQLFFHGRHRRDLVEYCRMFGIEAQVI